MSGNARHGGRGHTAIETVRITRDQATRILAFDETHFVDLKGRDIAPAKLTRTISAFSNASGGELYIGIEESPAPDGKVRAWRGFANEEAANGHLQPFEQLFPLGQYFSYKFLVCEIGPGLVLQVNVNKTREITRASDGIPYVQRGAQNLPATTPEALERLRLDKGLTSFETETISREGNTNGSAGRVAPETATPAFGQAYRRRALLFAEEPQAILLKRSGVKIYRYRTSATEGSRETLAFDPITIEGPSTSRSSVPSRRRRNWSRRP